MIAASDAYVMYFNQISGILHHLFSRYLSTFRHLSGLDVFQLSLLQDPWCMGRLCPKTIASNYNFLRFAMQSQLRNDVFLGNTKHMKKHAILAGAKENPPRQGSTRGCTVLRLV